MDSAEQKEANSTTNEISGEANVEDTSQPGVADVTLLVEAEATIRVDDNTLGDTERIGATDDTEEPVSSTSDTGEPGGCTEEPETVNGGGAEEATGTTSVTGAITGDPVGAPDGTSVALTANTEYACYSPSSKQQCWAVASLKAPKYEPSARASVDIVAVIDKSGSMSGQKINLVKKTLEFVIEQLKETDRISLVVYDTNVELVFGLMKMTVQNRERARNYVSSIKDGSSTNLCGGLLKGMEQVALTNGGEKAQVQSVLLLTDGLANHGITHKAGIIDQMTKMQNEGLGAVSIPSTDRKHMASSKKASAAPPSSGGGFFASFFGWGKKPAADPVQTQQEEAQQSEASAATPTSRGTPDLQKFDGTVYTFGFGSDHDADMLEAISTQGGGVYYYIDTNEKIPESFADCLGGLLSVMGQNVSVKLQAQEDASFKKVHTSKAISWTTPNNSCEVAMGDIQSEEGRDLVLELELPPVPSGTASEHVPLVSVELSYFNVITSQFDTVQCQLTINRTDGEQGPGNMTVDIQRNRVMAAAALKEAETLASQGNMSGAQECLKKTVTELQDSLSKDEDLVKLLVADLKKSMEAMKNRETYNSYGKNYVRSKQQSHSVQRTNYVEFDDEEVSCYMNSSKSAYRAEASAKKSGW